MRAHVRPGTFGPLLTALLACTPLTVSAEGLQRIHSRGASRTVIHVEGPATIHVEPGAASAPQRSSAETLWGTPVLVCSTCDPRTVAQPRGLLPTTAVSTARSYGATCQALDPIVDPLLEATANAVGTAAGTALGIGLYPPLKALEHITGIH